MTTRSLHARITGASRLQLLSLLALALVAAVLVAGCAAASGQSHTLYRCPMHPDYVSDKPGDCPICGMKLVPFEKGATTGKTPARTPANESPGQAAPRREPAVVGASLERPAAGPQAQVPDMPGMPGMPASPAPAPPASQAGHQHQGPAAPDSGGLAPVHLEGDQGRLAGLRTVAATKGELAGAIRAVGTVVPPDTGVRQVTTKVAGFVQKLYVNAVGRAVKAGEPLFDLYSPELLASQEEYVHAREVAAQFATSKLPEVQRGGQDLVTAARRRLELFDVPESFLARLDQGGKAQRTVTFRAPFSGYVMEKAVVEGQRVEPGMNLMTIADLSHAWVTAQLYEGEAAAARVGRTATVTLPYDDTMKLTGRIDLVYPTLDAESRTLKVRFAFPNPRLALKPGMFVNVELGTQRAPGVIVPDSAVIDTGTRQVVFVATAPGHFEPRDVQVGMRADGKALLRAGVREGEQVATGANFLLDSESRLRGAIK